MGLPHVVVRFYTNGTAGPHGERHCQSSCCSRPSTCCPSPTASSVRYVLGPRRRGPRRLGRARAAEPALRRAGREGLTALLAAGAFAAFLSTSTGLVVSVAGVVSQDLVRWGAGHRQGIRTFRLSTVVVVAVSLALTVVSAGVPVAHAVELTFAVAASTFCPMLLLGIWWRGLTARGAIAGIVWAVAWRWGRRVDDVRHRDRRWVRRRHDATGGRQRPAVVRDDGARVDRHPRERSRARRPDHGAAARAGHIDLNRGSFHPERWDRRPSTASRQPRRLPRRLPRRRARAAARSTRHTAART